MIATQGPFRGKLEIAFFAPVVKEIPCPLRLRGWLNSGGGHSAVGRTLFITLGERRAFSV